MEPGNAGPGLLCSGLHGKFEQGPSDSSVLGMCAWDSPTCSAASLGEVSVGQPLAQRGAHRRGRKGPAEQGGGAARLERNPEVLVPPVSSGCQAELPGPAIPAVSWSACRKTRFPGPASEGRFPGASAEPSRIQMSQRVSGDSREEASGSNASERRGTVQGGQPKVVPTTPQQARGDHSEEQTVLARVTQGPGDRRGRGWAGGRQEGALQGRREAPDRGWEVAGLANHSASSRLLRSPSPPPPPP